MAPRKLTELEVNQPNVRLIIPRGKFEQLPAGIQKELAFFEGAPGRYEVPGYRFAEWITQLSPHGNAYKPVRC